MLSSCLYFRLANWLSNKYYFSEKLLQFSEDLHYNNLHKRHPHLKNFYYDHMTLLAIDQIVLVCVENG